MARILVVDDSEDVRLALATILEDAGYEIIEASDGSQVPDMVAEHRPDLVLLDVAMPKVNGFETLRNMKADKATSDIPVLMVTAKGRPEDLSLARSLGARDFISKPWADGEVELRVGWVLESAARAAR
ncbi:MAG: response regulator [Chloroflexi bacterium]|nr:response regulator [Chloroflexota bacterium]